MARDLAEAALTRLAQGDWLNDAALVVVERGAAEAPPGWPGYEVLDERVWGARQDRYSEA